MRGEAMVEGPKIVFVGTDVARLSSKLDQGAIARLNISLRLDVVPDFSVAPFLSSQTKRGPENMAHSCRGRDRAILRFSP